MNRHFIFIAAAIVLLLACNSPKSLTKKGDKLQSAGLSQEAANYYYNALRKKGSYVDAQIGMKVSGQAVLNEKLQTFSKHNNFGAKKDAVYAFIEAEDYLKRISGVRVQLNMPEFYQTDFLVVKNAYLTDLYLSGSELLEQEKFGEAQSIFSEISKLDPSYKDAGELKQIATIEPLYRKGLFAYEAKEYRAAHEQLTQVKQKNSSYKDTNALLAECLIKGQYAIALLPFENASGIQGAEAKMAAYALSALTKVNDPFLKIIDRESFDMIIAEQHLSLSGAIDQNTAATVGNLLGAKALLSGTVLSQKGTDSKVTFVNKKGFESYQVKKLNPETNTHYFETKYKEVNYKEFSGSSSALLTIQVKLTSLVTGEILMSKVLEKNAYDNVNFATYEGNAGSLYPANGASVITGKTEFNRLQNLLSANRTLKDSVTLTGATYEQAGAEVAEEISTALKQQVK